MIDYPAHVMPFPAAGVNPFLQASRDAVWEWIDATGIASEEGTRRMLRRADPALSAAWYFPAASADLLAYLAQLFAWTFVNDEEFDEGTAGGDPAVAAAVAEERCAALAGAPGPGPLEEALAEWWSRLPTGRSRGWYRILRADLAAFIRSRVTEAIGRQTGVMPSLNEYLAHRRDPVGTRFCADLVEIVADVDLPDRLRRHGAYRAVKDAAADHCGLINDIYSAGKERAAGEIHNAVWIVQHDESCPVERALELVNDMATAQVGRFDGAARELSAAAEAATDVGRWTRHLRDLVRGNHDWHLESERYRENRDLL